MAHASNIKPGSAQPWRHRAWAISYRFCRQKAFPLYLLRKPLKIVTDHAVISAWMKMNNPVNRLTGWILRTWPYKFYLVRIWNNSADLQQNWRTSSKLVYSLALLPSIDLAELQENNFLLRNLVFFNLSWTLQTHNWIFSLPDTGANNLPHDFLDRRAGAAERSPCLWRRN